MVDFLLCECQHGGAACSVEISPVRTSVDSRFQHEKMLRGTSVRWKKSPGEHLKLPSWLLQKQLSWEEDIVHIRVTQAEEELSRLGTAVLG